MQVLTPTLATKTNEIRPPESLSKLISQAALDLLLANLFRQISLLWLHFSLYKFRERESKRSECTNAIAGQILT